MVKMDRQVREGRVLYCTEPGPFRLCRMPASVGCHALSALPAALASLLSILSISHG